jgi:Xaa-Pro aminopeptidase
MNYILKEENSVYYEVGYSCDNSSLLLFGGEKIFITDGRYSEEARHNIGVRAEVVESDDILKTAKELIKKSSIQKLAFDPYEWSVAQFSELQKDLDVEFIQEPHFSKKRRIIKTEQEIHYISTAVKYGKAGFQRFKDYLSVKGVGKKERELNFKMRTILQQKGSLDLSFDPIVAFNENTSKPHALPTDRRLSNGDLVLVDAGLKYKRYCSDRTETFMFNKTKFSTAKMSPKVQKIYDTVQKAHDETISKVKVGMKASEVDSIARNIITEAGFGDQFVHSTGHGVGLDIHEFPFISQKSDVVIEENMVFTVEPAIYIPNFMGVRIEDMVVMKSGGAKVL